jgi:hypothetical protein
LLLLTVIPGRVDKVRPGLSWARSDFRLPELIVAADRLSSFDLSRSLNLSRSLSLGLSWSLDLARPVDLSRPVRVVMADNATRDRSENSVTSSDVTCYATDDGPSYAALRLGSRDRR